MENTELIKVLDAEIDRVVYVLKSTRPESSDYSQVIDDLRGLYWFKDAIERPAPADIEVVQPEVVTVSSEEKNDDVVTFQSEPVGEPEPVVAETVEITYEDLRAAVKEKAASGKPMQPVIEKYVPEGKPVKLSSVPKAKYAELMKELNDAG